MSTLTKDLMSVSSKLNKIAKQANATKSIFSRLDGVLNKLGVNFGISDVAEGLGGIIKLGSDMEQTRISFETMLGSADKANITIQGLNEFSNVTPFNNKEVLQAGRNLLAMGVSSEKLIPTLRKIGDVSAGLNIPFNELSDTYGKIKDQNAAYGENLSELAENNIPIYDELSNMMGFAPDQIKKLANEGKISFPYIEQAFTNMTGKGGQFFNILEKQSQSFGGKWSTFMGKLQLAATKLGEKILPALTPLVDWGIALIEVLPQVGQWFSSLYTIVSDNALVFGLLGVALLALNAKLTISKISFLAFSIQFRAYVLWTKLATISQWDLNAAFAANPIGITIALIAALVAGIVYAYKKFGWFRGAIYAAWEYMKGFGSAIKELVVNRIKDILSGITGLGKALMQFFNGEWKAAWETGKSATADLMGAKSGAKFLNQMKGVGKKAGEAYNQGVEEVEAKKKSKDLLNHKKSKITGLTLNDILAGNFGAVGKQKENTESDIKGDPTAPPKGLNKGIDAVTGGGSKQTNINVTFEKLVETFTIQSQNVSQGISLSEDELKRMLLRVLNSINQMQTSPA